MPSRTGLGQAGLLLLCLRSCLVCSAPAQKAHRICRDSVLPYLAQASPLPQAQACFTLVHLSQGPHQETAHDLTPPYSLGRGSPSAPICTTSPIWHTWHWCFLPLPKPDLHPGPSSPNLGCLSSVCQCLLGLPAPTSSCHSPVIWLSLLPAWRHRREDQNEVD